MDSVKIDYTGGYIYLIQDNKTLDLKDGLVKKGCIAWPNGTHTENNIHFYKYSEKASDEHGEYEAVSYLPALMISVGRVTFLTPIIEKISGGELKLRLL